ncbi:hypothetical protein, partial [Meridianimarinicoccus zhengii]|uniref:hypothetical protein n=1 Tax=Meridianimarinicoccus zhengii TaxID=2056810 RepID=UPI001C9AD665
MTGPNAMDGSDRQNAEGWDGVVAELCRLRIHNANPCVYTARMSKPSPARYRTTNWSSYNA